MKWRFFYKWHHWPLPISSCCYQIRLNLFFIDQNGALVCNYICLQVGCLGMPKGAKFGKHYGRVGRGGVCLSNTKK